MPFDCHETHATQRKAQETLEDGDGALREVGWGEERVPIDGWSFRLGWFEPLGIAVLAAWAWRTLGAWVVADVSHISKDEDHMSVFVCACLKHRNSYVHVYVYMCACRIPRGPSD